MRVLYEQSEDAVRGRIVKRGRSRDLPAATWRGNPLSGTPPLREFAGTDRLIIWSGTLADDLTAADPRNWMSTGRVEFDRLCTRLTKELDALPPDADASLGTTEPGRHAVPRRIVFQPHARHVLSDVPSCVSFLRDRGPRPLDVALSPATMFEPSMLGKLEDHLERMFEALGPTSPFVFLEDIKVSGDGSSIEPTALGGGDLPAKAVRRLIRKHVPKRTPIVLRSAHIDRQRSWLGLS